jgi:hypothetical protein
MKRGQKTTKERPKNDIEWFQRKENELPPPTTDEKPPQMRPEAVEQFLEREKRRMLLMAEGKSKRTPEETRRLVEALEGKVGATRLLRKGF